MTHTETMRGSKLTRDRLDHLLQSHQISLGETQRRHVESLSARLGDAIVWDRRQPSCYHHRLIMIVEPPTGPSADAFHRSLNPGSVVVVPFGENPGFDFLKSKLTDFGTIGSSGPDGPHVLWWGGPGWSSVLDAHSETRPPLIVSCYPRDADMGKVARLRRSRATLKLDHVIEPVGSINPDRLLGFEKAGFIQNIWSANDRPILWVDPTAIVAGIPSLVARIDCDVAVHKWNRWEMSARTLYFARSAAAGTLLSTWHCFASSYPDTWDGYVLDQAWSLVSSQLALQTLWLPRSYHASPADQPNRKRPIIIHDGDATTSDFGPDPDFSKKIRVARRASRIGAPEAFSVIAAPAKSKRAVTVILRDVRGCGASAVAASIESITRAFAVDSGGFGHMELSLCHWQQDVTATISAANSANNRILEVTPSEVLPDNMFRRLAASHDALLRDNLVRFAPPPHADHSSPSHLN